MSERYTIVKKNRQQVRYSLYTFIHTENHESSLSLTYQMFIQGLCRDIYEVCIEFYLYHCCLYLPDYLNILLQYEQTLQYYYVLVLHLVFSPKKDIFVHFSEHRDMFFYLQKGHTPIDQIEDNQQYLENSFDIYYNSVQYYMKNSQQSLQNSINHDYSHLLYYLLFHDKFEEYSKGIWRTQFHLFSQSPLLQYIRNFHVLGDYVSSKKQKLLILYYTLQYLFSDVNGVLYVFQENQRKTNQFLDSHQQPIVMDHLG